MASVVMVHAAFCGGWSYERFRGPFEAAGHQVIAPDLRGHEAGAAPAAVRGVSMADYAADVAALCRSQPEPPIVIGHSMGGLVAQMVARRTPLKALVLLAPSPPWGVAAASLEETFMALGVQVISPFAPGAIEADRGLMRRYALDRMAEADRKAVISRLSPESGLAVRQTLNWWLDPFMTTSVGAIAAPVLVIAGERDVVHSPSTCRAVARRLGAAFEVMPGMSHYLVGEPGWDDVAHLALRWLADEASSPPEGSRLEIA